MNIYMWSLAYLVVGVVSTIAALFAQDNIHKISKLELGSLAVVFLLLWPLIVFTNVVAFILIIIGGMIKSVRGRGV